MEAMETGDERQHPAADVVRPAEAEESRTDAPADFGSSLQNQTEENRLELGDTETPLVPCRMEALNASPSHSDDETVEAGLASEKDEDDPEEDNKVNPVPTPVNDLDSETVNKGACSTSFNLDEMMDIGTVDQQEQEAQMCTELNNDSTGLEEEEARSEPNVDLKPTADMKVDEGEAKEKMEEEEDKVEGKKEEEVKEELEERNEVEEREVEEQEMEEVEKKQGEGEKDVEVNEKEMEVKMKEKEEEEDEVEEEKEKDFVVEEVKREEVEEEDVPFYATRSRSRAVTSPAPDMTNGMKVIKLAASSSSSSSSPPPIKIKDEPEDEEYELAFVSGTSTVKDEPIVAKVEDLQIDSVYSENPDGNIRRQRGRPSSSTATLNMRCAHCQKGLVKGQTAYQRKGSPALFCSTLCLTSSLSSSKTVKNCHRCQRRITRPQEIILAPDVDGVMRGFCSEACLSLNKSVDGKPFASPDAKVQSVCSICSKYTINKHEVVLSGTVHKMCSDSCFKLFRTANRLTMAGCANCGATCHVGPMLLKMDGSSKTLCNLDCLIKYKKKVKMTLPCTMCRASRQIADMVHNKSATDDSVSLFCSSSCVMAFVVQNVSSSGTHLNCENCGKNSLPAYHLAMSDTTIRNFCTLPCVLSFQEKFKKKPKERSVYPKLTVASSHEANTTAPAQAALSSLDCAECNRRMTSKPDVIHVKDKAVFVCGSSCALQYKTRKNLSAKCEYCKIYKISREVKRIDGKDCYFCSPGCWLLYEIDLDARWGKHCKSCSYCQCISKKLEKALYGESSEEFCSEECRSNYTMLFCHVAKCSLCDRKGKLKHSLSVLGEVRNFCDLPCLFQFCNALVKTQGDVFPSESPVIANVISLAGQDQESESKPARQKVGDDQVSLRKQKEDSLTPTGPRTRGADSQTTDPDLIIIGDSPERRRPSRFTPKSTSTSTSKSMKNKALLCKPLVQSKGVSCRTEMVDVEAQTDGSTPKIMVLPVPVPVYVPVPMSMYSQCTPNPVGVPLPLPVPVLLPVSTDNADRIVETIKKIKEKFPKDPFEAELVLMAEMVSETNGGDKEGETGPGAAAAGDGISTSNDDLNTDDFASLLNSLDEQGVSPPMDVEADFPIETLERMATLRELSTPPASPTPTGSRKRQSSRKSKETRGRKKSNKGTEVSEKKASVGKSSVPKVPKLKTEYGVDAWKRWIRWRDTQPDVETPCIGMRPLLPKEDLLRCTSAELSYGLCRFIAEVKRPSGEQYSADSLFYLCLGIQQHLFDNGRVENIFTDSFYCKFSTEFTNMLRCFQPTITTSGYIHSRVEEEFLWDCKQLGVFSPIVLLNTLLYFFCKNFGFTTVEQHRQLSFAHVMRCTKTSQGNVKTTFLRFYPPIVPVDEIDGVPAKRRREEEEEVKEEKILEMKENTDNPLRCPVRLYEFYLSKCSETVKQRTDVFYLLPERCCVPNSPLWFSATPLDEDTKEAMLTRILTVRQLHLATGEWPLAPEGAMEGGAGGDDDDDDWP
ncbi:zinc finger MYM-type protein 4 isoform X1 [Syngnathus typhle]|uniref:zinc finger MYM-type protein 4 isoform X1 n=1 Tax=Syngnathus typhle TaxID=161592 RepID=UPI002A6AF639|nr:zinc finger MYM-type protein 4 isoform X1 [Syngnathus typhle]